MSNSAVDFLLVNLVSSVEGEGQKLGVTLQIQGATVSGNIISSAEFYRRVTSLLGQEGNIEQDEATDFYQGRSDDDALQIHFIHLDNLNIIGSAGQTNQRT
jgi:hypothetical protein